jgi:hypothetical protein
MAIWREEFFASAETEVVGSTEQARDTSGEVAEDGILPGEFNECSRFCSDLFNWSFDY